MYLEQYCAHQSNFAIKKKMTGNQHVFIFPNCSKFDGIGEVFSLREISPFPTAFSKDMYCRHVKTRACLGKG